MDSPMTREPASLSSCNSARTITRTRTPAASNSPEFEFWMLRNPSFPQPNLLSADELFVDGVLLPLHLLPNKPPDPNFNPDPEPPKTQQPEPQAHLTADSGNGLTSSKRWKDIFKKGDKKTKIAEENKDKDREREKEKERKREKKSSQGGPSSAAELNINIWPFSRSRSAGNGGTRSRWVSGATRKVSSAPCSRSNSAGESKSRKWPGSPGRPGVHLGRSSPIWQVKRSGGEKGAVKREATADSTTRGGGRTKQSVGNGDGAGAGGGKVKVLNLNMNKNVPMCIGYRHHLSCRSDENSAIGVVGAGSNKTDSVSGNSNSNVTSSSGNGNLFNLKSLFTKKVY